MSRFMSRVPADRRLRFFYAKPNKCVHVLREVAKNGGKIHKQPSEALGRRDLAPTRKVLEHSSFQRLGWHSLELQLYTFGAVRQGCMGVYCNCSVPRLVVNENGRFIFPLPNLGELY